MKIVNFLKRMIALPLKDETKPRQEFILNTLLIFFLISFFVIHILSIIHFIFHSEKPGFILNISLLFFILFISLLWLSSRGFVKIVSCLLIITFALPLFFSFIVWGADLPAALLAAVLVITLSSILMGANLAFLSTFLISLTLIFITDGQARGFIQVQSYWRSEPTHTADVITYCILLSLIATVAWLFCQEIKRSLRRAQLSESLLREERDLLEIKVARRTQELRTLEAEKISQLYRLAEFGQISSGIFHDLINPLTAVSLNLEQIKTQADSRILDAKSYLNQALLATHKMESLISSIKKQINRENTISLFSPKQEIEQISQILAYKANKANVEIIRLNIQEIKIEGDAVKFGQVILNLLANAIEACEEAKTRNVVIIVSEQETTITISVNDSGNGILPENLAKIFTPFFSTKAASGRGLGLGLASTKNIVERDFSGQIKVSSEIKRGTDFIVIIPKKYTANSFSSADGLKLLKKL